MVLNQQNCDQKNKPQLLSEKEIHNYLPQIPGWSITISDQDTPHLVRSIKFKNYQETLHFINIIAEIINKENHHPDICFGYNSCSMSFTTHSANGLTLYDFICAAKIDQLFQKFTT